VIALTGTELVKEATKQFAGEAGKDAWKGIKSLVARIRRFSKQSKQEGPASNSLPLLIELPGRDQKHRISVELQTAGSDAEVDARFEKIETRLLPAVFEWLEDTGRPDLCTEPGWLEGEAGEHILRLERESAEWQRQHQRSEPIEIRQNTARGATIELTQSADRLERWSASVSAWPDSDVVIAIDTDSMSFRLGDRRVRVGFLARLFFLQLQKREFRGTTATAG
jgi:hypothetical protein